MHSSDTTTHIHAPLDVFDKQSVHPSIFRTSAAVLLHATQQLCPILAEPGRAGLGLLQLGPELPQPLHIRCMLRLRLPLTLLRGLTPGLQLGLGRPEFREGRLRGTELVGLLGEFPDQDARLGRGRG